MDFPTLSLALSANEVLPYCILGLSTFVEGPVSLLVGGAAVSNGLLLPLPTYLSVVAGNLFGDFCWYSLGRFSGLDGLLRFGPRLGVDLKKIQQLKSSIQDHAARLIFLAKLTVGFPIPVLITTGLSRVAPRRWVWTLVLGELIKSAALVAAGYAYGSALQQASVQIQIIFYSITAAVILAGLIWFKVIKKRKPAPQIEKTTTEL